MNNLSNMRRVLRTAGSSTAARPTLGSSILLLSLLLLPVTTQAASLPPMGTAANFAVLGASTVTNTGGSIVTGDLGVSPGTAVTGFPPGAVTGTIYTGVLSPAGTAQADALVAYNDADGQVCNTNLTGQDLGGLTLTPGVYCFDTSAQLTGTLTLDFLGDSDAVFIFQTGSTLTTASNAVVTTINGSPSCSNVVWQIGSSATLGTETAFFGNVLALVSITVNTAASSNGGMYALTGAVTLANNAIAACSAIVPDECATNADCGDGTVCTTDTCDVATSECVNTNNTLPCNDNLFCTDGDICGNGTCAGTPLTCGDGNVCTSDSCDETANACVNDDNTLPCNDDLFCTEGDTCGNGTCTGTPLACGDGNVCTNDSCDETANACVNDDNTLPCNDNLFCTEGDTCGNGACTGTPLACGDANACTNDSCDEAANACVNANNTLPCDDGLFCTNGDICGSGTCSGTPLVCADDGNVCTTNACDEATNQCASTNNTLPCNDGLFCNQGEVCSGGSCGGGNPRVCGDAVGCTTDACNETTDQCDHSTDDALCEDEDSCTVDTCDPLAGCEHEVMCTDICRTPGYWGTHAGYAKSGSFNVTQAVLDYAGGLEVCGELITTTSNIRSPYLNGLGLSSALEGLCVNVKGVRQRQLYRQLIATALNCEISGGNDCDAILARYVDVSFDDCNALCAAGGNSLGGTKIGDCIEGLDCFNNGGLMIDGSCVEGGGCHDEALCNEAIGICPTKTPASSSKACKEANGNDCTIDSCE